MTLAAGVQWDEAYAAVNDNGRLMVGAFCDSVGSSGGWLAGGGHSALSPNYGLGRILGIVLATKLIVQLKVSTTF